MRHHTPATLLALALALGSIPFFGPAGCSNDPPAQSSEGDDEGGQAGSSSGGQAGASGSSGKAGSSGQSGQAGATGQAGAGQAGAGQAGAGQAGAGGEGACPKVTKGEGTCAGCQAEQCCHERSACEADPDCKPCLGSSPPAGCGMNAALQAFFTCSYHSCSAPCGQSCGVVKFAGACGTCADASCCAEGKQCTDAPSCLELSQCAGMCKDAACVADCNAKYPAGKPAYDALVTCLMGPCKTSCYP